MRSAAGGCSRSVGFRADLPPILPLAELLAEAAMSTRQTLPENSLRISNLVAIEAAAMKVWDLQPSRQSVGVRAGFFRALRSIRSPSAVEPRVMRVVVSDGQTEWTIGIQPDGDWHVSTPVQTGRGRRAVLTQRQADRIRRTYPHILRALKVLRASFQAHPRTPAASIACARKESVNFKSLGWDGVSFIVQGETGTVRALSGAPKHGDSRSWNRFHTGEFEPAKTAIEFLAAFFECSSTKIRQTVYSTPRAYGRSA